MAITHALIRASIYVTIAVVWRIINIERLCSTVEVARDDETSIRASPLCVDRSGNAADLRESFFALDDRDLSRKPTERVARRFRASRSYFLEPEILRRNEGTEFHDDRFNRNVSTDE